MSNADFKDVLDICMINGILRKHNSIVGGFLPFFWGGGVEQAWRKGGVRRSGATVG